MRWYHLSYYEIFLRQVYEVSQGIITPNCCLTFAIWQGSILRAYGNLSVKRMLAIRLSVVNLRNFHGC